MADKIKKLSDAIRLGATFRPQCFSEFFAEGGSCALGAAKEAVGAIHPFCLSERFPALAYNVEHPVTASRFKCDLYHTITNLNDVFGWTRERIADWVASIGY